MSRLTEVEVLRALSLGRWGAIALAVWLFSFAFYTGEAEEDEIVMEKRLR